MRVRLYVSALALATLAGCGRNSGFLRDANTVNEHQFRMEIAAQRYVRSVSGSSEITSILCVIPTGNGAYRDAMASLHAQAKLQMNEVLENIREDHAFLTYVFVCLDDLIISADVYEVIPTVLPPHGYAPPERASNFPAPVPAPPVQFEPSEPYKPPPNRLGPSRPDADGGALLQH